MAHPQTWQERVADKKARQEASIPKEWILTNPPPPDVLSVIDFPESSGLLSAQEIEITNAHVDGLLERLASAQWSAVEVATAFAKRAIIAHQLTNCLTEIFVERALTRAAELDAHLKTTGKVVGPLHGLPISLKDQIDVKGVESTMGYVGWIGHYAERDAILVDTLESLGAVFYVKTNVPQTLMFGETFNNVFGRTVNPHNRTLTSGGSSGGEGALIALKGAAVGVGSDIGGSIRIPSAFSGTYGFRPTTGRIPYAGSANSLVGQDSLSSVLGPLSNSIGGIKSFVQGVVSQQTWLRDPNVIRKKWDDDAYRLAEHGAGKQLVFAVLWDDGHVVPHPPIIRGLELTRKALIAAGHKVIDWKPLNHKKITDTAKAIFGAGAATEFERDVVAHEPYISSMSPNYDPLRTPADNYGPGITAFELWQLHSTKRDLRQEYLEYWLATESETGTGRPVDAIISPVAPRTAPPHGENESFTYTLVFNTLDYPALVIPVTKVDQQLDVKKPAHKFLSEDDKINYERYEPSRFTDAPIAVQVVGRTHEDEAVIALAEIVDAALRAQEAGV